MSSFYGASGGDDGDDKWGPGGCTSLHQMHGLRPLSLSQVLGKKKRQEKIVMCTAYDLFTARVADDAMIDILLVGDSLANVVLGEPRTSAVDLDTMIMFAKLVAKSGTAEDAENLLQQALDLQQAGASLLILEMVCAEAAQLISENLRIPTIGIGAGGTGPYANLYDSAVSAVEAYRAEVVGGLFPQKCNATCMKPGESEKFAASCARRSAAPIRSLGDSSSSSHTKTQADSIVSTSADPCLASRDSSSESQGTKATRPYKVCVWGGGRMGQLIAWILAGPAPLLDKNAQELSSGQQLQARGMEVSICTNRQDLLAASTDKEGLLEALQPAPSDPNHSAFLDAYEAKLLDSKGDCAIKATLPHNGTKSVADGAVLGEKRRVTVLTRKEAEKLEGIFDLVIVACHSGQTHEVGTPSSFSGLALRSRKGTPPALVFMPTSLAAVEKEPLVIQQVGSGCVRICGHLRRSSEAAEQLYGMLAARGIPCELLPHHRLDEMLWEKAAVNCFINPLTALLNCLNSQLADPRMQLARKLIVSEVVAVARGKGIPLTFAAASAAAHAVACATNQNVSSTLGQLREGRSVELADISGEVVREANAIGLRAPANKLLLELVGVLDATRIRCLSA
ncbi:hypothetical protein ACSSS7_002262 [Eimeria intestinalis]